MRIYLEDMEAFVAVASAGSFRQAAASLGTSQPTITNRIQRLEECLGLKLFGRTTRRITLTEAGVQLLPRAERSVADIHSIVSDAHEEADLKKGRVAVGATPTIAAALIVPLLRKFMKMHPDVSIRMLDDFRAPLMAKLASGQIDLAIIPFEAGNADFNSEVLFAEDLLFVAPRSLSLPTRCQNFSEIAGYPFVTMLAPSAIRTTLAEAFATTDRSFRPLIEVNNQTTLLRLIESGVGLSLLPSIMMRDGLLANVDVIEVENLRPHRQISLVTARNRAHSPAAAAFAKLVKATLKRKKVPMPR